MRLSIYLAFKTIVIIFVETTQSVFFYDMKGKVIIETKTVKNVVVRKVSAKEKKKVPQAMVCN